MKVKVSIKLSGRDVLLMHKNTCSSFINHVYTFMDYHGCSRTSDELQSISTDELLKDMWYLGISPESVVTIPYIEDEQLHEMLYSINQCGGEEVELGNLFHAYVQMRMDSGEWENV